MALAVLGGLHGDRLEAEGSPLHEPMALRVDGRVARVPEDFAGATGRLVVLVHGLFETEHAWTLASEGYGARLARDLGATPLYVRYNTGRHISRNGCDLAALLDATVAAWPVPVESIALVGHSMGGLVARSACHHGGAFTAHVRHVVSLGSPHAGAPLAQGVHYAAHALHALPETRPLARLLRRRSAGIRDLRSRGPRRRGLGGSRPRRAARRGLRGGAAARGRDPLLRHRHRHARPAPPRRPAVGDWLVLEPSASGRGRVAFDAANGLHVGGAHHLALLDHPAVYAKLRDWLRGRDGSGRRDAHVDAHVGAVDPHDGLLGPRRVDVGDHAGAPVGQLQLRPDRIRHDHLAEDLHDRGVERGPGTAADDAHAHVRRLGRRVGPLARHGVEDVGDRGDAGQLPDPLGDQPAP